MEIMTPKEKANELVHEFVINMPIPFHIEDAKICSLITVDEILNLCWNGNLKAKEFWFEVKQEIEKL